MTKWWKSLLGAGAWHWISYKVSCRRDAIGIYVLSAAKLCGLYRLVLNVYWDLVLQAVLFTWSGKLKLTWECCLLVFRLLNTSDNLLFTKQSLLCLQRNLLSSWQGDNKWISRPLWKSKRHIKLYNVTAFNLIVNGA